MLSKLVAPVIQTGVEQLNKLNLGNNQLAARLAQAGSRLNVSDYRAQQLITAACFAGLATAGCVTAAVNHALHPLIGLLEIGRASCRERVEMVGACRYIQEKRGE